MPSHETADRPFYTDLSRYYDGVFTVAPEEMAFLATRLRGRSPLLDVGCGTGNRTEHLAGEGGIIHAVDLDEGMIEHAEKAHAGPGISYGVMDMMRIDTGFAGTAFGAVLCLGNTLVHLDFPDAMTSFCRKAHALLQPGGLLVLQILNYDRILERGISSLPDLESPEALFSRRYEWENGRMHFVTDLRNKSTGETAHGDAILYPLRKAELDTMLHETGFSGTEYYGSYSGAPFTDDSFILLSISRRE
ncbi:class I SAM-dependent methyltransferase [Desulfovibrio sp. OttesenSCG-928-I05]|nr:class I SAM-dependent methyltransferase [Desulfovibrio sp. OttesenSCG-928-I05]